MSKRKMATEAPAAESLEELKSRTSECPLCHSTAVWYSRQHKPPKDYYSCSECGLVHLHREFRLAPAAERARYETHENSPEDIRYRTFLAKLGVPLLAVLKGQPPLPVPELKKPKKPKQQQQHQKRPRKRARMDATAAAGEEKKGKEEQQQQQQEQEQKSEEPQQQEPDQQLTPEEQAGLAAAKAMAELPLNVPSSSSSLPFANISDDSSPILRGLDYGCGPGPTLGPMLEAAAALLPPAKRLVMESFDVFFKPDLELIALDGEGEEKKGQLQHDGRLIAASSDAAAAAAAPPAFPSRRSFYDVITCTETVEHFLEPDKELERLDALCKPGGLLGIMTQLIVREEMFQGWWYLRDPTHVSLFRPSTIQWLARRFNWEIVFQDGKSVVVFRKRPADDAKPHTAS